MNRTPLQLTNDPYLEAELDKIPNLDLDTLRKLQHYTAEEKSKTTEESNQIETSRTLRLSQIPYQYFDSKAQINWFIKSNLLAPLINPKPKIDITKITLEFAKKTIVVQLIQEIFWLIHYIKLFPKKEKLIDTLRKKVTQHYSKILPEIQKYNKNVAELVLLQLHFLIGYIGHSSHYKIFQKIQNKIDTRFILDCYHIVIFELTGILVSDFFIHKKIEEFYGEKFFFYKEENALKLTNVDPTKNSVFLQSYGRYRKNFGSLKANNSYSFESRNQIFQLYRELKKKFDKIEDFQNSKNGLMANLMHSEYKKRIEDLAEMSKFDRAVTMYRIEKYDQKFRKQPYSTSVNKISLEEREFNKKTDIYLRQKKSKIHKKFKFDCAQISPPLRDLIGNRSKIPVKRKQIHMSNVQLPDFSAKDLATLYRKNREFKPITRKEKSEANDKLGLFFGKKIHDHFNLVKKNKNAEKLMNTVGLKQSLKRKFMTFYKVSDVIIILIF